MSSSNGQTRPFVVILTGGIASGKTVVSDRFARLGVPVIDTDVIARELVQPGQAALNDIVNQFGEGILDESGHLDRGRMRERVFSDAAQKQRLEAILHPAIGQQVRERINALEADYCILVVPLLVESGKYRWADRVLVVDVDEQTQVERVMARDSSTKMQAEAILKAQASRDQRLAVADDVIFNQGSLEELDQAILGLHERYRGLARQRYSAPG
ncbi:MAG TPA: dephospho-CoA kinase [Xanthomonadales bacterium]|nr:dephospho-CoA kinase [Xanthomonadales bacterium]